MTSEKSTDHSSETLAPSPTQSSAATRGLPQPAAVVLILLGWLSIVAVVGLRLLHNQESSAPIFQAPFHFNETFNSGVDSTFWRSIPIMGLGETCLYPERWETVAGHLLLDVVPSGGLCFSGRKPFRGSVISSRYRFEVPFRVNARMKVAGGPGIISALYTYTDPIESSGHYENDFEFPADRGKRSRVQMNYYGPSADPSIGDVTFVELPEDPSTHFNNYTIEVYADKSVWKVNDQVVRTRVSSDSNHAERVLLNTWFNREWVNFYKNVQYENMTPLDVESVELTSLSPESEKSSEK